MFLAIVSIARVSKLHVIALTIRQDNVCQSVNNSERFLDAAYGDANTDRFDGSNESAMDTTAIIDSHVLTFLPLTIH